MANKVYLLLSGLGITANYTGFFYAAHATCLCASDMEYLLLVTKRLYPEVAAYYSTSAKSVERNIRTVIDIAWECNPKLLMHLAKRELRSKPTVTEFLAILTTALLFSENGQQLAQVTA